MDLFDQLLAKYQYNPDSHWSLIRVNERSPTGEHVSQHVFGDFRTTHAQGVAGVLHLPEALAEHMQLLGHLVRTCVPDVGEAVVDLPQELTQLEGCVDVTVTHTADAEPH